jgi:hypothetical protein
MPHDAMTATFRVWIKELLWTDQWSGAASGPLLAWSIDTTGFFRFPSLGRAFMPMLA